MGVRCGGWEDAGPAAPGVQWVCVVPGEMEVRQLQVWLEGCRLVVRASDLGQGSCTSWVSEREAGSLYRRALEGHERCGFCTVTRVLAQHTSALVCTPTGHVQKPDAPPAPPDLYLLAARLLSAGLVTLEGLLPHLAPSDEEIGRTQKEAGARRGPGGQLGWGSSRPWSWFVLACCCCLLGVWLPSLLACWCAGASYCWAQRCSR